MADDADGTDDAALRARWRELVGTRLPGAARAAKAAAKEAATGAAGTTGAARWPVRLDHCFARILLDDACGRPWREAIRPPAWRNAPHATLERAIATGEAVLAGDADLHALNRRSLALRGKLRDAPDRPGSR